MNLDIAKRLLFNPMGMKSLCLIVSQTFSPRVVKDLFGMIVKIFFLQVPTFELVEAFAESRGMELLEGYGRHDNEEISHLADKWRDLFQRILDGQELADEVVDHGFAHVPTFTSLTSPVSLIKV